MEIVDKLDLALTTIEGLISGSKTGTAHDGTTTPPLKEYLVGKRQVQAMMMAHKGKVVFEIYPGVNPTNIHIWMSASKPTVGLLVAMLAEEGKIDLDKPVPTYVPEIERIGLGAGDGQERDEDVFRPRHRGEYREPAEP